jgi:zinc transport system substrate-binding protein
MKKALLLLVLLAICLSGITVLGGCAKSGPPDIVVTIFPAYDWVKVVLGENPSGLRVQYLMENGTDPHFYSPSIQDTAAIIGSKLFIYIGEAEAKVTPILRQNPSVPTVSLTDLVETKKAEHDALPDDHDCDSDCIHAEIHDEHVWLSLRFARVFVTAIANELSKLDPAGEALYKANAAAYNAELAALDDEFENTVGLSSDRARDTVLFADRFPFLYMMDDYGINWYAAYSTCSTETAITLQRRIALEEIISKYDLRVILILENSSTGALASEMVAATGATSVRVLNAMQIVSSVGIEANNLTYLSIMRENLGVLTEALA